MGTQKIHNLQVYFDGLNLGQKKEFIDKLKKQLSENGTTQEYSAFLQKCIQRYNSEVSAHNGRGAPAAPAKKVYRPPSPVYSDESDFPKGGVKEVFKSRKFPKKALLIGSGVLVLVVVAIFVFAFWDRTGLVGTWHCERFGSDLVMEFRRDGTGRIWAWRAADPDWVPMYWGESPGLALEFRWEVVEPGILRMSEVGGLRGRFNVVPFRIQGRHLIVENDRMIRAR